MFNPHSHFSTSQYLYHFTSLETALEKILPTGKLRLGPFLKTNDPRETKEWLFPISFKNDEFPGFFSRENMDLNQQLNNAIKKHCKVLCFCKDYMKQPKSVYFGRSYQRPSLWAHYAENHRGVCLVFDRKKLVATARRELRGKGTLHIGSVVYQGQSKLYDQSEFRVFYSEVMKNSVEVAAEKLIKEKHRDLFFWKHDDWKNECEYRFVLRSNNDHDDYISVGDSIKGIIIGCDFPYQAYQPIIQHYMSMYHMASGHMQWHNGLPTMTVYGATTNTEQT